MLHRATDRGPSTGSRIALLLSAAALAAGLALLPAPRSAHAINVALEWTAPGDDSTFGTAVEYDLRYSFKPYFPNRFNDAPRWMGTPQPGPAGTVERCIISDLDEETIWYFAIKARDERGNMSTISNIVTITPSVGADGAERWKLAFSEAVPSPARTGTRFAFSLPRKGRVSVEAVDVTGRRVRRLLDGEMGAGAHDLAWDLRDDHGRALSPGIYFVRAEAGGQTFRRRVAIMH